MPAAAFFWIALNYGLASLIIQLLFCIARRLLSRGEIFMTVKECRLPYILVADDDSSEARAAANAAFQIARVQDLAIRGLYVADESLTLDTYASYQAELPLLPDSNDYGRQPTSRAELMRWFENQGTLALDQLQAAGKEAGVSVTTELLAGGVSELVLRKAAKARLLAIGRRGHEHKDAAESLGHNFRKIAHHVHVPMLVGGNKTPSLHRLLLAYNGRAHANDAHTWAVKLQRALSAEMIVLTIREDTDSSHDAVNLEEIQNRLAHSGLAACRFLTARGRPENEIAAVALANDVDLIILGRYRHSAVLEWLVGSTVDRLLRATSLPMLIA
jgi:nucleotide-binding universal stress UspA family protein